MKRDGEAGALCVSNARKSNCSRWKEDKWDVDEVNKERQRKKIKSNESEETCERKSVVNQQLI